MSRPFDYKHGPFKDMTVRTSLRVLQSPISGRKLSQLQRAHLTKGSRIDVRPIEPPPIVQIQFFEVNPGDGSEREIMNYRDLQLNDGRTLMQAQLYKLDGANCPSQAEQAIHVIPPHSLPVYASQECTMTLMHGDIFSSAVPLHWEDREIMVCAFGFLSVHEEGTFVLSFRTFNIETSPNTESQTPISAMAWSDTFRIFATRDAPAVGVSTPLTIALSRVTALKVRVVPKATTSKKKKRPIPGHDGRHDTNDQNSDIFDGE
ncbi:hypothetical protein CYLTODRAFT_447470 [Cylindrobasidium torrendii FP15055 ss-10]|uniref:Velvet domain-containing protein n=1 Tax=Cylindrobasidium torrendii FP15055 ss-10 TaxID=1314674 RepID=A0A0D7AU92_9AGAR|nr:hypothetical protein CYLTODRAFT_447470 [Cylindrobasidium torrendii FP15055 ss-10]